MSDFSPKLSIGDDRETNEIPDQALSRRPSNQTQPQSIPGLGRAVLNDSVMAYRQNFLSCLICLWPILVVIAATRVFSVQFTALADNVDGLMFQYFGLSSIFLSYVVIFGNLSLFGTASSSWLIFAAAHLFYSSSSLSIRDVHGLVFKRIAQLAGILGIYLLVGTVASSIQTYAWENAEPVGSDYPRSVALVVWLLISLFWAFIYSRTMFWIPEVLIERRSLTDALRHSWSRTRRLWAPVAGLLFTFSIARYAMMQLISSLNSEQWLVFNQTSQWIIDVALLPLWTIAVYLLWQEMRFHPDIESEESIG